MKVKKLFAHKADFPMVDEAYAVGLAESGAQCQYGKYFFAWGPSCPAYAGNEISNSSILDGEDGIEFFDTKEAAAAAMQDAVNAALATMKKEFVFRKDQDGTVYATADGWTNAYTPDGEVDTSLEHQQGQEITQQEAESILEDYGWAICETCGNIYPAMSHCSH